MMRNTEDAGRCGPGVVSTGVYPSQELQRRFPIFDVAVRIAINAALMKLRKKHRLLDVSLDESAETEEPSARIESRDQGPSPEQLYAQQEQQRILSEAMDQLTPGMRKAIELQELDERSTEETARIMEFPSAR